MDRVEAVGVHVVRQTAGAADATDEDDVLLREAEVGHYLLGLGEDRVVAAARAPADLLVGHEVLAGELAEDRLVLGAQRWAAVAGRLRRLSLGGGRGTVAVALDRVGRARFAHGSDCPLR